jgi:G patch domain-containing protein 1
VFDYLSKEDRERIEHAAASLHPPTSEHTLPPVEEDRPVPSSIPSTAPHIATAALKGFMPFANDPAKQARYVAYLRSQATPEYPELVPPKLPDQTTEVYHKELHDYSKSAAIFKPVSGAMASRFTTAAVVESGPKAIEGLHQPTHQEEPAPAPGQEEKELDKDAQRPSDEAQSSKAHAARTGMYGALTREIVPWQPSRLLCKRFGVKDPNPDITTDTPMPGVPSTGGNNTWKAEEALAEADLQTATGGSASDAGPSSGRRTARDLENVGLGEDDTQGRDTLTYVRPSMDIFKAIFASDDEDSDDEQVEEGGGSQEKKDETPNAGPSTLTQQLEEKPAKDADADSRAVPPHLRVHDAVVEQQQPASSYEPRSAEGPSADPVDMATFKPVFVPRAERETQKRNDKKDGRGKDKDDKKKRVKAIVSFEDDEEGAAALVIAPQQQAADKDKDKGRKKKKRRKEKEGDEKGMGTGNAEGEEDVEMWVEKELPRVVASFASTSPAPPPQPSAKEAAKRTEAPVVDVPSTSSMTEGPPRGRKRAIDFL